MNDENLRPLADRTPSEQREFHTKGGIASGEARRRKKTFKELLELALETEVTNSKTGEVKTLKDLGMLNLAKKVKEGDIKAIKLAAELTGEFKQQVDVNTEGLKIVVQDNDTAEKLDAVLTQNAERGEQDKAR